MSYSMGGAHRHQTQGLFFASSVPIQAPDQLAHIEQEAMRLSEEIKAEYWAVSAKSGGSRSRTLFIFSLTFWPLIFLSSRSPELPPPSRCHLIRRRHQGFLLPRGLSDLRGQRSVRAGETGVEELRGHHQWVRRASSFKPFLRFTYQPFSFSSGNVYLSDDFRLISFSTCPEFFKHSTLPLRNARSFRLYLKH